MALPSYRNRFRITYSMEYESHGNLERLVSRNFKPPDERDEEQMDIEITGERDGKGTERPALIEMRKLS